MSNPYSLPAQGSDWQRQTRNQFITPSNGEEQMIKGKIGFIGGGKMAESLIKGIINAEIVQAENIYVGEPDVKRRSFLQAVIDKNALSGNGEVVDICQTIILAVKPDIMQTVAGEIAPILTDRHLLISIAPGIALEWLRKAFGVDRIVRAMPNTPAIVGSGATAFCTAQACSQDDIESSHQIFSAVGLCIQVREQLMDAVTGLSGSGPAYALMTIQALSDGGVKMGLPREDATRLAAQTMLGAANLVLSTEEHPEKLKDMVTTPGGTTIAGVHALERRGLRNALIDAVEAATAKSSEMGR